MKSLPFNPELLLSFFMSENRARSFAGDLEERFRRIRAARGKVSAINDFLLELLHSIPPLFLEAVRLKLKKKRPPLEVIWSQSLERLTPTQLELFMVETLDGKGFDLKVANPGNHDVGFDIITVSRTAQPGSLVAIQVKHHL